MEIHIRYFACALNFQKVVNKARNVRLFEFDPTDFTPLRTVHAFARIWKVALMCAPVFAQLNGYNSWRYEWL